MSKELFREAEGKLFNYNMLKAEVESLRLDIEDKEDDYRGCGSICYGERTSNTNNISKAVENEVLKKEKEIIELKKELKKKERRVKKIDNALTVLNEDEIKLVENKYFSNKRKSWNDIAGNIGLSVGRSKQVRSELIEKIKRII